MKRTAALLRERGGPLHVSEVTFDDLRDGEVPVRIAGVGVCHTDLAAIAGTPPLPLPAVLGHEGAGTVEQVAPAVTAPLADVNAAIQSSATRTSSTGTSLPALSNAYSRSPPEISAAA